MIGNYPIIKMILLTTIILGVPFAVLKLMMWFIDNNDKPKPLTHSANLSECKAANKAIEHNHPEGGNN